MATESLAAFAEPQPLVPGPQRGDSIGMLPVLFHLLRSHELTVDVSVPMPAVALVSAGLRR
ncbi:hypothetical protein ACOZGD_05395 [Streptomyces murinus]